MRLRIINKKVNNNMSNNINFGQAIEALKQGKKVQNTTWNRKDMFISRQVPDKNSKMTLPYLYITIIGCNDCVPWVPSQFDMESDDWKVK